MSSKAPVQPISAARTEERLDLVDGVSSGEESSFESSLADTATSYHGTMPENEDSGVLYDADATAMNDAEISDDLVFECNSPDDIKQVFYYAYGQWKQVSTSIIHRIPSKAVKFKISN